MISEPEWIETDLAIAVHKQQIKQHGGLDGLRDEGRLQAAMHRPRHAFDYDDSATLFTLAASYAHGIVSGHPFIDGNKRTSVIVCLTFLAENGWSVSAPPEVIHSLWLGLADGSVTEGDLATWLASTAIEEIE